MRRSTVSQFGAAVLGVGIFVRATDCRLFLAEAHCLDLRVSRAEQTQRAAHRLGTLLPEL